ncbi:hypothetical protein Taro_050605 [Colocasia esculenta]|uniref:BAG domain-containing protein n=1 Tax=Colocasia esculenta TaxID=4460 RepID=A0A843XEF5_COLES|nr:hypothetical protein [Colocasia esculenta]
MQNSRFFSASAAAAYLYFDHGGGLSSPPSVTVIPVECPSPDVAVPIFVHSPGAAAVKIQAAYRGHLVRSLVRRVRDADAEAGRFELLIRTQEVVDAVRRDARERLRVAEGLMALLLRLDGVPGFYPAVRELRRATSRRIVALQELLDAIVVERIVELEGLPSTWEEVVWGVDGVGEREVPVDAEERVVRRGLRCLEKLLLG